MKKTRFVSFVLSLLLLALYAVPGLAADITAERLAQLQSAAQTQGLTLLYTGVVNKSVAIRETPDSSAAVAGQFTKGDRVGIISYTTKWLHVVSDKRGTGYILRQYCDEIVPIDTQSTMPYGALTHNFTADVALGTAVYMQKDFSSDSYCQITAGSRISFWYIEDGWAVIPYWREIGYVHVSKLKNLTPVSPTVDYAQSGDVLAAFTSFYSTKDSELNRGRMVNIDVACEYISALMQPGESWSFNGVAGPYKKSRGYQAAPVLIDGTTVPGYGGGTCQVSTTLYNTILLLPHGLTVTKRRPHGPSGAKYVPHGVDAAVGNESLDLVFRNDFDFPVRIDARSKDGALYIAVVK